MHADRPASQGGGVAVRTGEAWEGVRWPPPPQVLLQPHLPLSGLFSMRQRSIAKDGSWLSALLGPEDPHLPPGTSQALPVAPGA